VNATDGTCSVVRTHNKAVAIYWDQRGSTFVSELLALAIVGATLMILLGGLGVGSRGVLAVERRVSAEHYAREQMDAIKEAPYSPDPPASPYPTIETTDAYELTVTVEGWNPLTERFEPFPLDDSGLQRVEVAVYVTLNPERPVFVLEDYKGDRP
jgi:hypothetical protein